MKSTSKFSESNEFSLIAFCIIIITLTFLPFELFSQPGTWMVVYGGTGYDRGTGIAQTFDKGYIVCATTSSYGMGNSDIYLLKIDSAGKFQWQNTFGGTGIDNCYSVIQTNDSGFIICGFTNSYGPGGYDGYLVKADSIGNLQWQKTFGGSSWDFAYWVEETNDGGFILAGETFSYGNNNRSYLVKTDKNGDTLWAKTYGGTQSNLAKEVHQTPDNGYIFAGTIVTNKGDKDFYLVKTNSSGDTLWTKSYGGTDNDSCNTIAVCKNKELLLGGCTDIGGIHKDLFIRTDSLGGFLYSVVDTPSGNTNITISRIIETSGGQLVMLVNADPGSFGKKDINLYEWDSGSWPWGFSFGGPEDDEGYDLLQTADSGFVLVGYTHSFGIGPDNIFIAKTNSTGHYDNTVNSYVAVNEISEESERSLIYPNPFSENLFLKTDPHFFLIEKKYLFEISDLCGREIMSEEGDAPFSSEPMSIKIPREKFSPGFYLASLQSGNKKIYRKLLFIQ